ncbi:polyprenyl synthetase family protein [uncultured Enterovirga sp.]|uniref:polyprenyl synthetase family protein n=1 Tax=uncultured Enterovirga sp. TaxID=2026352 RepID=UPI0035CBCDDA
MMANAAVLEAPAGAPRARSRLSQLRSAVERRLHDLAPPEHRGNALSEAVRYALLAPGKRIRPLLVLLACDELGRHDLSALDAACALEMVHAASLVLDDLPSMDDAATRRGRPSTHIRFGQDVAILASVSLLASAFGTVATSAALDSAARARVSAILAMAIGTEGLAGGQYADLRIPTRTRPVDHVSQANQRKTAALFVAAVEMAEATQPASGHGGEALRGFGAHLGQAFQILDDLEDGEASLDAPAEDAGRTTLVGLLGRAEAGERLRTHLERALDGLNPDGDLASFVAGIFAGGFDRPRAASATVARA